MDMHEHVINSNLIEGVSDPQEVLQSLKAWDFLCSQTHLDRNILLETHRIVMANLWPEIAGRLREVNVRVGLSIKPHFMLVPQLLSHWLRDMDNAIRPEFHHIRELHPQVKHIDFENIHPFRDGNGRVGRLLMWWHQKMLGMDPLLIKYEDRESYYSWF